MPRYLVSADSHVQEPLDLWTSHLPAHLKAGAPRIETRDDGKSFLMVENRVLRRVVRPGSESKSSTAAAGAAAGDKPKTLFEAAVYPAERLRDLDKDGVWAEVMYPNLGFMTVFRIENPELQVAAARVYNDWVADLYIGSSDRFAPVALLPAADIPVATAEIARLAKRGFRSVLMSAHCDARPYNDPAYETLWATAEDYGMPLTFHAGTGRTTVPAHGPGGAVINYVVVLAAPMETVAYLCAAGILERHPKLRIAMVECGSGWLAWALNAMDEAYREHSRWVQPKLKMLPSEYFRRQGAVTFQNDPVGLANIRFTGDRCLMWGSDYPHPEGTWPRSREILAGQLEGLPQKTIDRVLFENATDFYRLSAPS